MANRLKAAKVLSIETLRERGWSQRRIARELGISRGAVIRHLQKQAESAPDRDMADEPNSTTYEEAPTGSIEPSENSNSTTSSAKAPTGSGGSRSLCEPLKEVIIGKLNQGLAAQRIYQDLCNEHGFDGKYHSVRRFVAKLKNATPLPFRRIDVAPGEEAQIDFGTGAPIIDENGKRRRTHVLRVVLSHSRKGYSEVVYRQTTDELIGCLENAFHHFGGVPKTIVPDNLKAAVIKADWYDPDLNPKLQSFCEHYGTALLPTKPRTPRHKGKVERGVDYVQENALKGRTFSSLQEQNAHLQCWEATIADTRIHGTTQKQVRKAFKEDERPHLQPVPLERFATFQEGQRKVSRDGHVSVDKSYYSLPPEYLGHTLWVRWDSRLVRLYDKRMKLICTHAKQPHGKFSTLREHLASEKISRVERGADWMLRKAAVIGPKTREWSAGLVANRGVESVRVLNGLLSLTDKHPSRLIELACETAHANQCYRLKSLRQLIKHGGSKQQEFEFLDDHPMIRNLSEYGKIVCVDFGSEARKP